MRALLIICALLLIPAALAATETLTVASCTAAGCNPAELNSLDNVSGMTVGKGATEAMAMNPLSVNATIDAVGTAFSHSGEAGISGSWTVSWENSTDGTPYCTASTPHASAWTSLTLTPTGCAWTSGKLQELRISVTNNDGQSPQNAFIDYTAVEINYTRFPGIAGVTNNTITHNTTTVTWSTAHPANSTLGYGTTTSLGTTLPNATLATTHDYLLALSPNTTYYYNVTSCTQDACETQGPYSFTTLEAPLPGISNIQTTNITTANASISWDTTEQANSTLDYGTTTALGNQTSNASLTTTRSFTLNGLDQATTYYYNVTSCTGYRCETQGPYSFTTQSLPPPAISNVQAAAVTGDAATITWDTDVEANSTLRITAPSTQQVENTTLTTSHSLTVTGLGADTTYTYEVESCNGMGCATSGPHTFSTPLPGGVCTLTYLEKGPSWEQGLIQKGDIVRLRCQPSNPITESTDLTIRLHWAAGELLRTVTTPRLLAGDLEVLWP